MIIELCIVTTTCAQIMTRSVIYLLLLIVLCKADLIVDVDGAQTQTTLHVTTFEDFTWFAPPTKFEISADKTELTVASAHDTDFWRKTHYGFIHNNGNFYYYNKPISSNFTLSTKFVGKYEKLYDQTGIMVRLNEKVWVKTGIEFFNDKIHVSAVVTNDYSDWNVIELSKEQYKGYLYIKMMRSGHAMTIMYKTDEAEEYKMLRLAYLDIVDSEGVNLPVHAGVLVSSPIGDGFESKFSKFELYDGSYEVHFN